MEYCDKHGEFLESIRKANKADGWKLIGIVVTILVVMCGWIHYNSQEQNRMINTHTLTYTKIMSDNSMEYNKIISNFKEQQKVTQDKMVEQLQSILGNINVFNSLITSMREFTAQRSLSNKNSIAKLESKFEAHLEKESIRRN